MASEFVGIFVRSHFWIWKDVTSILILMGLPPKKYDQKYDIRPAGDIVRVL